MVLTSRWLPEYTSWLQHSKSQTTLNFYDEQLNRTNWFTEESNDIRSNTNTQNTCAQNWNELWNREHNPMKLTGSLSFDWSGLCRGAEHTSGAGATRLYAAHMTGTESRDKIRISPVPNHAHRAFSVPELTRTRRNPTATILDMETIDTDA